MAGFVADRFRRAAAAGAGAVGGIANGVVALDQRAERPAHRGDGRGEPGQTRVIADRPASGYTLVIKDSRQEGGNPPSQEFASDDGTNGTSSLPESFFYCKM